MREEASLELCVKASIRNIDEVTGFVNHQLRQMGCSKRSLLQIDVALDELFSNICRYAYDDVVGNVLVSVEELEDGDSVQITLVDKGIPFDPLAVKDPDVTLKLQERTIGGLGIFMVKRTMDDVQYEYRDGKNILTVVKSL